MGVNAYSDALAGDFLPSSDGVIRPPKSVVIDHSFDWQSDKHPKTPLRDTILYELHVAGFTKSPTSRVAKRGTYLGLIEKIPYLLSLGITAVELMPIHEFPILHFHGSPFKHPNYWGTIPWHSSHPTADTLAIPLQEPKSMNSNNSSAKCTAPASKSSSTWS